MWLSIRARASTPLGGPRSRQKDPPAAALCGASGSAACCRRELGARSLRQLLRLPLAIQGVPKFALELRSQGIGSALGRKPGLLLPRESISQLAALAVQDFVLCLQLGILLPKQRACRCTSLCERVHLHLCGLCRLFAGQRGRSLCPKGGQRVVKGGLVEDRVEDGIWRHEATGHRRHRRYGWLSLMLAGTIRAASATASATTARAASATASAIISAIASTGVFPCSLRLASVVRIALLLVGEHGVRRGNLLVIAGQR